MTKVADLFGSPAAPNSSVASIYLSGCLVFLSLHARLTSSSELLRCGNLLKLNGISAFFFTSSVVGLGLSL